MIIGQEKPDGGTLKVGADRQARLRRSVARRASRPTRSVWQEISVGAEFLEFGKRKISLARLHVVVQLPRLRSAEAGQGAVGRRAQPAAPGEDAQGRRQPAAPRRADQRSRRRHAARARGGALSVRRLRGGHPPRSLVPRSHRHAHPRLRGRRQGRLVRGQLPGLRGRQASAASAPTPTSRTASATRSSRTKSASIRERESTPI